MSYSVVKGTSYVLAHAPDMVLHNGTTQTTEKTLHPDSEYLKELPKHLRTYEEAVNYLPNQVYIGNAIPADLKKVEFPWYTEDKAVEGKREGKFGEIMPQDEFIGLIKMSDAFELVLLSKEFTASLKEKFADHKLIGEDLIATLKDGEDLEKIEDLVNNHGAEALIHNNETVGCVKTAHDVDVNLNAHVMFENLAAKASGVLAALHLLDKNNIDPMDIDYIIECSEEACGDMNQRGGGNFAKAIGEVAGLKNATGSDVRGFCAAPAHSIISAASLVSAGTFKNVMIVSGGSTAKLGMNGKDHVKKDMPIIEDVVAGFAMLVSENDGVNPILRNDITGRHTIGTGSAPQATMSALCKKPLEDVGLRLTDVDKFAAELQNPDVTKPAGAGDVPLGNYKMIGALAVMGKDIERSEMNDFIEKHGMEGWAPTQGHIPSGAPYVGVAREEMLAGEINRVMIIGKGSLFLGRLTNQFDGVSIVIEKNTGKVDSGKEGVSQDEVRSLVAETMREFASHLLED